MSSNQKMVKRFSKWVIVAHWTNAFAFFALYITALPLYTDFFSWMYPIFGGPENLRLFHRIFAVLFILPPLVMMLVDPKSFFHWIKQTLTWRKNDLAFFTKFPKEFFGGHVKDMPKQDFYNAGEKLNSILTIFSAILLIGSGVVMWFASSFPIGLVLWAYPIHNIAFGLSIAVVVGHIFLSVGHPNSKVSMQGMTKGDVPVKYAKEHHEAWYDELVAKGEIKKEKPKNRNRGA